MKNILYYQIIYIIKIIHEYNVNNNSDTDNDDDDILSKISDKINYDNDDIIMKTSVIIFKKKKEKTIK